MRRVSAPDRGLSAARAAARRAIPALALPLALSACTGDMAASLYPGARVEVGGDVFTVRADTPGTMTLRNFATGAANQARLFDNAGRAAALASGCAVATLSQDPGANVYRATLDCP
ncbi:MAG: hypothetical protein HLUCCA08_04885 [Rhodobacteraceae bacterium HLUCCA08]|nr:MAG: hypothetical protein HLUCCA08_04885 [Rhodobacteraceae bacterium HLUCCA08]